MNPSLPRYPIAGFQWIYFACRKSAQINIGEFRLGSLCERFLSKSKRLSGLWYSCRRLDARSLLWLCIGIGTGNPGVFQGYPYPYPRKPVPVLKGTGFEGYGYGFSPKITQKI